MFEFITHHLNDKCVIRLKISRNSNEKSINEDGKEYTVKLTRHFFLEGLGNLLIHRHVERMREQSELTDFEWEEILSFAI